MNPPGGKGIMESLILLWPVRTPYRRVWEGTGHQGSVHQQPWPSWDRPPQASEIEIVIQVNGKVGDRIMVPVDIPREDLEDGLKSEEHRQKQVVKVLPCPENWLISWSNESGVLCFETGGDSLVW